MNWVQKFVVGVIVFVVVMMVGSLFLSSKWSVQRSIVIDAKPAKIYPLVANFKKGWTQWSAFQKEDPGIVNTYSGPDTGVGAVNAWKSRKMGDGECRIVAASPKTGMEFDLRMAMMTSTDHGAIAFTPEGKATRVTWSDAGDVGSNPGAKYFATFFMDRMLGGYFERSLANLKQVVEAGKR